MGARAAVARAVEARAAAKAAARAAVTVGVMAGVVKAVVAVRAVEVGEVERVGCFQTLVLLGAI